MSSDTDLDIINTSSNTDGERTLNNNGRAIVINVDNDGQVNVRFDGNFSLYEVLGLYSASLLDVISRYFIAPSVVNGISTNVESVAQHIDTDGLKEIAETLASLKKAFGS